MLFFSGSVCASVRSSVRLCVRLHHGKVILNSTAKLRRVQISRGKHLKLLPPPPLLQHEAAVIVSWRFERLVLVQNWRYLKKDNDQWLNRQPTTTAGLSICLSEK